MAPDDMLDGLSVRVELGVEIVDALLQPSVGIRDRSVVDRRAELLERGVEARAGAEVTQVPIEPAPEARDRTRAQVRAALSGCYSAHQSRRRPS